jgi:hypothetical protein
MTGDDEARLNEEASSPLAEHLVGMMAAVETFTSLAVAAGSYRAKLEEAGFSPTASEVMATDFHRCLVMAALTPAIASGKPSTPGEGE